MEGINKELMDLYYQSDNCIRCGRCTTVCPTFAVTKKETMVARGRVLLAREYVEGNLNLSSRLKLYYDLCLRCNACLEVCPPRIKTADLMSYVKLNIIKKKGLSLTDSAFLKGLLNKPSNMRTVMLLLNVSRKTGINNLLPDTLKIKEKVLPDIPEKSFREQYSYITEKVKKKKFRVGYFVGCLTDNFYPDIANKILERKVRNIKRASAHYVAAGCPACLMQLDFGRREFGTEYTVKHTIQLLAQTIGS